MLLEQLGITDIPDESRAFSCLETRYLPLLTGTDTSTGTSMSAPSVTTTQQGRRTS
jgi:hypothetical protein